MACEIYWVHRVGSGRLGTMARPRGGDWLDVEAKSLVMSGVDIVVSALTRDEIQELDLTSEEEVLRSNRISYLNFPIVDRGLPESVAQFKSFLHEPFAALEQGKTVITHCRMGIGRASILAASLMAMSGVNCEKAFGTIEASRGLSVPDTEEQKRWLIDAFS